MILFEDLVRVSQEDDFAEKIRRIVNCLVYNQDVSAFNPLDVAAARILLKDQEEFEAANKTK